MRYVRSTAVAIALLSVGFLLAGLRGLVVVAILEDLIVLILSWRKSPAMFWWVCAVNVTLVSLVYQRMTGPTYPLSGTAEMQGGTIAYSLPRTHGGDGDQEVRIVTPLSSTTGTLSWRRHKTNDPWTDVAMQRDSSGLAAKLPHQPPAGKLDYRLTLHEGNVASMLPAEGGVVIRFRGDVPALVLVLHVAVMFISMLFSVRAGLELWGTGKNLKTMMYTTLVLMGIGGLILGPIVQKYAFGAYWTGWPFGHDMTDNKTLVAFLAWGVAVVMLHRGKPAGKWAFGAAVVTLVVFLIPHSVLGSELNYEEMDKAGKPAGTLHFMPAGGPVRDHNSVVVLHDRATPRS